MFQRVVRHAQFAEIIERGTHTELLARQGFYYNLYMSQFRYQEEQVSGNDHQPKLTLSPASSS